MANDLDMKAMFERIDGRPAEELSMDERESLAVAEAMDDGSTISLESFSDSLEDYSGHVMLRMPKSLHRKLKKAAEIEGVSLNQYIVYRLV